MQLKAGLYVVATPIGNDDDISLRARNILENVDIIAAEDTRNYQDFCTKNRIKMRQCIAHHEHNEENSSKEIVKFISAGQSVALVSDAGTPNVSDPGFKLLRACIENNLYISAIPGPSALTTALSICPIGGKSHFFGGFLANKSNERKKELLSCKHAAHRLVFYEAPHRIVEHLKDALEVLGDVDCAIFRELSKTYEEILYHPVSIMIQHFEKHKPKGEFVVIFKAPEKELQGDLNDKIKEMLAQKLPSKEISKILAKESGLAKKDIYLMVEELKNKD